MTEITGSREAVHKHKENGDKVMVLLSKALEPDAPLAAYTAYKQVEIARDAATAGNMEAAFCHYKNAMVSLFEAELLQPGKWSRTLVEVNREYGTKLLG